MTIYAHFYPSPVGNLLLIAENEKLIGIEFEHEQLAVDLAQASLAESARGEILPIFCKICSLLDRYFAGEPLDFTHLDDLAPKGTPFQQTVWQMLRQIPYGQTTTYSDIAKQLGKPNAVRAVGGAVGRNPISILIPCHRVLGKDQTLTGFGGGLPTKRYLLELEQISYKNAGTEFVKPKRKKWQS